MAAGSPPGRPVCQRWLQQNRLWEQPCCLLNPTPYGNPEPPGRWAALGVWLLRSIWMTHDAPLLGCGGPGRGRRSRPNACGEARVVRPGCQGMGGGVEGGRRRTGCGGEGGRMGQL
ncbi:unnamed protein product [Gadus morhua 'NCC']